MGYYEGVEESLFMGTATLTTTKSGVTRTALDNSADLVDVYEFGGNWTHRVGSNTAYGYSSTRCSLVFGGVNNTRSVKAVTTQATTTVNSTTLTLPTTGTLTFRVNFTRGSTGSDSRAAFVNDSHVTYTAQRYFPYYYYFYYSVDNSTRGFVSNATTNGSNNTEGTIVHVNFVSHPGYFLNYVYDNVAGNTSVITSAPYDYSLASYANRTVIGYFGAYTYSLTLSDGGNGAVTANKTSGEYGYGSLITFAPSFGYEVDYFTINGVSYPASSLVANQYALNNVTGNWPVVGYFKRAVNMYAVVNGTLRPLDMRACVGGALKIVNPKFCIDGSLR